MRVKASISLVLFGAALCFSLTNCASKPPLSPQDRVPDTRARQNAGSLHFDPQGADFTAWIKDFKNQVYRNWMIPQAAFLGYGGLVDFEFTLETDGKMSAHRMLKSSGTRSLDLAARKSLTRSRFKPLPDDYGPPRVTMQVTFNYGPPKRE